VLDDLQAVAVGIREREHRRDARSAQQFAHGDSGRGHLAVEPAGISSGEPDPDLPARLVSVIPSTRLVRVPVRELRSLDRASGWIDR